MQLSSNKLSKKLTTSNPTLSVYNNQLIKRSTSHKKSSSKSRTLITTNFLEHSATVESFIKPNKKRHITWNIDTRKIDEDKAKLLEDLLNERLEQLAQGKIWRSELEVVDSIYDEICEFFHKFRKILKVLKEKFEKCVRDEVMNEVKLKIDRVRLENENLVKKINSITEIHDKLLGKYEALKENQNEYERILINNPGFLVNYHNVVDIMIKQTERIDFLKAENRTLKGKIRQNQVYKVKILENQDLISNSKERSIQSAGLTQSIKLLQ